MSPPGGCLPTLGGLLRGYGRVQQRKEAAIPNPISPAPVTEWRPEYLPAYLCNGMVGLRVRHCPLHSGVSIVSGLEGLDPETGVEAFGRVPYPLYGDVRIGAAAVSDPSRAEFLEQRYDFSCGELHTQLRMHAEGRRADIEITTLCSRTQPTLVLQQVTVRVDHDCDVTISAGKDWRDVPGRWFVPEVGFAALSEPVDGTFGWRTPGNLSSCGIAYTTEFDGTERFFRSHDFDPAGPHVTTYSFQASPGQKYRVRQIASIVPESVHSQPVAQAVRLVTAGRSHGFDALRADNRRSWEHDWRGRIVLVGAPQRWQALADAAFFYLNTSVHAFSPSSTSVFGLAYWPNYHYYRGHLLWDIETFAIPPLLLINPFAARALLRFRCSRLQAARDNASISGLPGAKYPWESSLRYGHEAAPVKAPGPHTEHHVSMDVAIALARYLQATGDGRFARETAWPVLSAVAEWIVHRVTPTDRGYEIREATGIAETGTTVDNSAFVNAAAILALREATALGSSLSQPVEPSWNRVADKLVIPMDTQAGIIVSHDGYRPDETMGQTPEGPAVMFPLGLRTDPETERRTLEFYLQYADKYAGTPMLSSMLGVYGAWLGDRARSLDLFEKGYGQFVIDPYTITTEYAPSVYPDRPVAGPFTANIGGFLTSCLYGLTGLRLSDTEPAAWFRRKVVLPEGWDAIQVERVFVHGRPATLHAEHGADRAQIAITE